MKTLKIKPGKDEQDKEMSMPEEGYDMTHPIQSYSHSVDPGHKHTLNVTSPNSSQTTTIGSTNMSTGASWGIGSSGAAGVTTYPNTYQQWYHCGNCGTSYSGNQLHVCPAAQKQQTDKLWTPEEKTEEKDLSDVRKEVAAAVGTIETMLGFIEDPDQIELLDEASYYIREALKNIRRAEEKK